MARTDFDEYAESYESDIASAMAFVKQDPAFFLELKADALIDLLRVTLGDASQARVLDVGCGHGELDRYLLPRVAELCGVDISAEMIARASRANPAADYATYEGGRLPFDDSSFDLAFTSCVLHHVSPSERPAFVAELGRIVRPGGIVAILEHNPANPLTRIVVSRCRFDADAVLLPRSLATSLLREQGLTRVAFSYILFFPWRGHAFRRVERALKRLALGAQYIASARRPEARAAHSSPNLPPA